MLPLDDVIINSFGYITDIGMVVMGERCSRPLGQAGVAITIAEEWSAFTLDLHNMCVPKHRDAYIGD